MAARISVTSLMGSAERLGGTGGTPSQTTISDLDCSSSGCVKPVNAPRHFPHPGTSPMSIPPGRPRVLDFFGASLVIEPSQGRLSGHAGPPPIRLLIGLAWGSDGRNGAA